MSDSTNPVVPTFTVRELTPEEKAEEVHALRWINQIAQWERDSVINLGNFEIGIPHALQGERTR